MVCVRVGVIGINFKTADLSLREAMARGAQSLADERAIFFRHPIVLLSTCNRTEIYFSSEDLAEGHSDILAYLRSKIEEPFEHRLYSFFGIDCFAHLCRVVSGLDSAIFGETEIQRQVKIAYGRASQLFSLPSCIHYVFQKALKVGKTIRSLIQGTPTLYGLIWQLAEWKNKRILLVGYSEINRGFISFLMHKGINRLALCTKNPAVIKMEGVDVYDRKVLHQWQEFDLIVSASKADDYLIQGQGRGQVIFDLSVPRNVDPEVGNSTTLYNIDQLKQDNFQSLEQCEALLLDNVLRLVKIYRSKIRHALGNGEMESHLLCSPCPLQTRRAAQSLSQSRHEELIHILGAQGTTNSLGG